MSGKENNSSVKRKRRRNYILYRRVNVYFSIMCVATLEQILSILRLLIAYLKNKVNQLSFCIHLAYNFQPDTSIIILITESCR